MVPFESLQTTVVAKQQKCRCQNSGGLSDEVMHNIFETAGDGAVSKHYAGALCVVIK